MNYTNKPTNNRNKGKQPRYKESDVKFKKPKYKRANDWKNQTNQTD